MSPDSRRPERWARPDGEQIKQLRAERQLDNLSSTPFRVAPFRGGVEHVGRRPGEPRRLTRRGG